ncbi:pyridoxal kinase [Oharaeibacter diazotrophicus]|uniref:pyridoxal kinase n=1 Tax=Oharaeibacter diazotrophicus TaxID=1920512 RepID=A0A4V3CVB2_9HYPH|nr:pyridoxal kinase [Oharaeibacter diazotrophicus]TDP81848.1 pyridoxine kinase [Oharaeibacter diazotrophicus]BBE73480.1 pyridoxine kinase [Pleomorphomonas sp. SM30]GLS75269.1 pyridoxal kinase [Oharaeibacter diazotrophicus]
MSLPEVLVVSSHVVRGSVGSRAGFALERLGHRTWTLPTVVLPWHPGHGRAHRLVPAAADFAALCDDLCRAPWLGRIGAVMTGYLGAADQAEPLARLIRAVKAANPAALAVIDPVSGDDGATYVPADVVLANRDVLMPLSDLTTPNYFELALLTGRKVETMADVVEAARALSTGTVVVTSVPAMMRGKIATVAVTADDVLVAENQRVPGAHAGTGDLFAATLVSRLLSGAGMEAALAGAAATTFEMVARTVKADADELLLAEEQAAIQRPTAMVDVRRWAAPRRPAGTP